MSRKRYPEDPEKVRVRNKRYRAANLEQLREYDRQRRLADPEGRRSHVRAWQAANPEKIREHNLAYYAANRERCKANMRAWDAANRDKKLAISQRRRARMRNAAGVAYTTADKIAARIAYYAGRCFYCSAPNAGTVDHRIPLNRGGSHFPANLVPACKSCNCSKQDRTEREFLRLKGAVA